MSRRTVRGLPGAPALLLAAALPALVLPPPLLAQPIVQPLPDPAAADLSDAMQRLSRDPQSLPALIDAGRASVQLEDIDAADGFFTRAAAIAPGDGRVLAGQARVALARQDAITALRLFDEADAAGTPLDADAAARGLAYDLVGLNTRAQVLYGQALSRKEDDEIIRRMALSYAISGDQDASEATLLPLLQAQDLAAYRTRAFTLAIAGRADEAVSIAETMLPARIAQRLAPYLRYMARLTRAQQAAAANFGVFPHPTEIGQDRPEIAAFAGGEPAAAVPARRADSRLIPGGPALGPPAVAAAPASDLSPAAAPSGELPPVRSQDPQLASAADAGTPPPALPGGSSMGVIAGPPARPAPPEAPPPGAAPVPREPVWSSAELASVAPREAPAASGPPPAAASAPPAEEAAPPQRAGLVEAFADFRLATGGPARRSPDAVDITSIVPARDAPLEREPPVRQLPVNPSRHWVQLATGQDVGNFRFDWRRIAGSAGELLAGQDPFYAAWGVNNRLVTGPFESEAEAQKLVTSLAAKGVSSFVFTSTSGERVIPLP